MVLKKQWETEYCEIAKVRRGHFLLQVHTLERQEDFWVCTIMSPMMTSSTPVES